ncbi:aspartyl-phosphate phosphatase Spo0E family protein [Bacillus sp. UNC438CL73TsuS30]|uniref:aspartyl-phosphate phosphatase Spo0E family protein n=1 Tax=Bacillus sp. UNC438CL73TsuS30 TaxID=1340434 RepID=UPI000551FDF3|nr:aspartyl-phosphate phosphatase Spo0E family protein [Bacillus sp. UNC438CL73TsuS30]
MKLADLEMAISKKREEMIQVGMDKGLVCHETIKCSQELDQLLNDYNHYVLIETKQTNPIDVYHEFLLFLQKTLFKSVRIGYSSIFSIL